MAAEKQSCSYSSEQATMPVPRQGGDERTAKLVKNRFTTNSKALKI